MDGKPFTYEEFLEVYLACKTNKEVATKLGIHVVSVSKIAKKLRDQGIPVPERSRSGKLKIINVENLTNIINGKKNGSPA